MDKNLITQLKSAFDDIVHRADGTEYWLARELQIVLGYSRWEGFSDATLRAISSCESTDVEVSDHFRRAPKMVAIGSGAQRDIGNMMLSRYACYLIAQNGDPRKNEIAFAQNYFALQTRKQELIEERIEFLARVEARERLKASENNYPKIFMSAALTIVVLVVFAPRATKPSLVAVQPQT